MPHWPTLTLYIVHILRFLLFHILVIWFPLSGSESGMHCCYAWISFQHSTIKIACLIGFVCTSFLYILSSSVILKPTHALFLGQVRGRWTYISDCYVPWKSFSLSKLLRSADDCEYKISPAAYIFNSDLLTECLLLLKALCVCLFFLFWKSRPEGSPFVKQ